MKFIAGIVVGYFLFRPLNENNKFDRATLKAVKSGGEKFTDFVIERLERWTSS